MKIQVKIEDRVFEVEVGDLSARPILATVEGETFEVWPQETQQQPTAQPAVQPTTPVIRPVSKLTTQTVPITPNGAKAANMDTSGVLAPLPGVIVNIAVQSGATVSVGQELCTLEAMKMKNTIRASRDGQIAAIHISVGQTVKHKQKLMDFA